MRKRPVAADLETDPTAVVPLRQGYKDKGQNPVDQGDSIRPWLVSGGHITWLFLPFPEAPVAFAGFQLLASYYVPEGVTGFVKQIKACPFKPSMLRGSSVNELVPNADTTVLPEGNNPDGTDGFWRTPFGWEGYFPFTGDTIPFWRWHLRFVPGDIANLRQNLNIPLFSFADPLSWYLVPNLPVPQAAYPNGIPGNTPGSWAPQRIQRFGGWEEGEVHIPVPSNNTVCLFAEWTQETYRPHFRATTGEGGIVTTNDVFALGPSFGQLEGYNQPNNSKTTQRTAREGWNS